MSEKTTTWPSAEIFRFVLLPVRQGLLRFLLAVVLCAPVAMTFGDDGRNEKPSDSRARAASAENDKSGSSSTLAAQIDALIAQLDSRTFAQREKASIKLAELGEPVIGPLAFQSFDCSPETGWRIKKTLESICTSGSESVFFKAIAILNLRFNVGNSDSPELARSLAKLEFEWRKKRRTEAIAKLRAAGATIQDPFENTDAEFQQMPVWRGANLVFNNNFIEYGPNSSSKSNSTKQLAAKEKLTEKQLRKKIKTILDSSLDENRELVFGNRKAAAKSANDNPDAARNIAAQMALQNQIRANRMMIGRQVGFNGTGVTIELGDKWKGQTSDLTLLDDIENLQQLSFRNQPITSKDLKNLAQIDTLTKLIFDNCELDANGIEDADWKILNEVELKNQTITSTLMESCVSIPLLRSVTFSKCKMKRGALNALSKSKNLRMLQFEEIEIDDKVFEVLADLTQVNYVNLSVCKFETEDYKNLAATRPNLQIAFTAQAFFGVRGPVNVGLEGRIQFDRDGNRVDPNENQQFGVSITDVIADSGAQKAGVKVGDVIQSVNGQSIEKFEDLRLQIAQHRAGDKLKVTVRRGNKPVKLEVVLGSHKNAPRF